MKMELGLDERDPSCFLRTYSVVMVLRKVRGGPGRGHWSQGFGVPALPLPLVAVSRAGHQCGERAKLGLPADITWAHGAALGDIGVMRVFVRRQP